MYLKKECIGFEILLKKTPQLISFYSTFLNIEPTGLLNFKKSLFYLKTIHS